MYSVSMVTSVEIDSTNRWVDKLIAFTAAVLLGHPSEGQTAVPHILIYSMALVSYPHSLSSTIISSATILLKI